VLGILTLAIVASLLRPMDPSEVADPTALGPEDYRQSEARREIEALANEEQKKIEVE